MFNRTDPSRLWLMTEPREAQSRQNLDEIALKIRYAQNEYESDFIMMKYRLRKFLIKMEADSGTQTKQR